MAIEHGLHDHAALAGVFRALSEPARLQIVHELDRGEIRVGELAERLGLAQSTTSAHLRVLREAGLLEGRAVGRSTLYRVATPALSALLRGAEDLIAQGLHAVVHDHAGLEARS